MLNNSVEGEGSWQGAVAFDLYCGHEKETMAPKPLTTRRGFETAIRKGVALVDFNAPWCDPCRAQEPILNALAQRYYGRATISMLNIDEHGDLALHLGIQSIPTLILFQNGREIARMVGLQKTETLQQILDDILPIQSE